MKRDKTHMESVERWAEYVRNNQDWRKHHNDFINAQYEMAYRAIEKIAKTLNGREKIKKLYGIQNELGYPRIFLR